VNATNDDQGNRRYRKVRRAEQEAETRRSIVDATLALHEELGPARTTISAIAERAGVQRVTVYRHFPDEADLLGACGAAFVERDPPPNPSPWPRIEDDHERWITGLGALYAWYRRNAEMLANTERDAPRMPQLAAVSDSSGYRSALVDVLAGRADVHGRVRNALALAVEFPTWRTLAQGQSLSDDDAAELMSTFIAAAAPRT
jgi:AcrR family transcriptional regulator